MSYWLDESTQYAKMALSNFTTVPKRCYVIDGDIYESKRI